MIKCWVDSSFDDKRNVAGIGILIVNNGKKRIYSLYTYTRTNNEAELFAIHIANILTHGQGTIYTDSQTAIDYINGNIKDKPRTQEKWINHKYCEYWAYQIRKSPCKVEKVKAHTHNFKTHSIGNRLADLLAQNGRGQFYER